MIPTAIGLAALSLVVGCASGDAVRTGAIARRTAGLTRFEGFVPLAWDRAKGQLLLELRDGQELFYGWGLAGGAGVLEASLDRGQLSSSLQSAHSILFQNSRFALLRVAP